MDRARQYFMNRDRRSQIAGFAFDVNLAITQLRKGDVAAFEIFTGGNSQEYEITISEAKRERDVTSEEFATWEAAYAAHQAQIQEPTL